MCHWLPTGRFKNDDTVAGLFDVRHDDKRFAAMVLFAAGARLVGTALGENAAPFGLGAFAGVVVSGREVGIFDYSVAVADGA